LGLVLQLAVSSISGVLMVANIILLTTLRPFAWRTFFVVGRWALLAYVISAGMIDFAFIKNHTKGSPLVVVTSMLVIFAVDVPLMIAFTVARYQNVDSEPAEVVRDPVSA
jgi:hypothetical protein